MRTFYGRIINIPAGGSYPEDRCYLAGHRDARHAAAEIACEADALLLEAVEISRSLLPILQQQLGPEAARVRTFLARVDAL